MGGSQATVNSKNSVEMAWVLLLTPMSAVANQRIETTASTISDWQSQAFSPNYRNEQHGNFNFTNPPAHLEKHSKLSSSTHQVQQLFLQPTRLIHLLPLDSAFSIFPMSFEEKTLALLRFKQALLPHWH